MLVESKTINFLKYSLTSHGLVEYYNLQKILVIITDSLKQLLL